MSGRPSMVVSVAFAIGISTAGCSPATAEKPSANIRIATGGTAGVYYPLGAMLARLYSEKIPGVTASAQITTAAVFNVQAVERGSSEIALAPGDIAYLAHKQGIGIDPHPLPSLRAMAVLFVNAVHIVARHDSGVRNISDLRGRRVGVGSRDSATEVAARIILESYGMSYRDLEARFLSFDEVAAQLESSTLDAGFIVSSYPVAAITDVATSTRVRLLPIDPEQAEAIRLRYPFYKSVTVPSRTYPNQTADVLTIGGDNLLLCRADLPDAIVYELTRVLIESLPELRKISAELIDPEEAPATPLALHPGAARYYRQRELLRWIWQPEQEGQR